MIVVVTYSLKYFHGLLIDSAISSYSSFSLWFIQQVFNELLLYMIIRIVGDKDEHDAC